MSPFIHGAGAPGQKSATSFIPLHSAELGRAMDPNRFTGFKGTGFADVKMAGNLFDARARRNLDSDEDDDSDDEGAAMRKAANARMVAAPPPKPVSKAAFEPKPSSPGPAAAPPAPSPPKPLMKQGSSGFVSANAAVKNLNAARSPGKLQVNASGLPTAAAAAETAEGSGACDNYRVDMTAARFGDCKCGWPKAAHSDEALKARPKAGGAATLAAGSRRGRQPQRRRRRQRPRPTPRPPPLSAQSVSLRRRRRRSARQRSARRQ